MTSPTDSSPERGRERPKVRAEVVPAPVQNTQGEIYEDSGHLVGVFHLPLIQPAELKYHVGRRTLTLWSRKDGYSFQTIMVLPRWVRPETFILSHKNGVYEFVLEVNEEAPPALPTGEAA